MVPIAMNRFLVEEMAHPPTKWYFQNPNYQCISGIIQVTVQSGWKL